jgi:hypothetical protein
MSSFIGKNLKLLIWWLIIALVVVAGQNFIDNIRIGTNDLH